MKIGKMVMSTRVLRLLTVWGAGLAMALLGAVMQATGIIDVSGVYIRGGSPDLNEVRPTIQKSIITPTPKCGTIAQLTQEQNYSKRDETNLLKL